jgi:ABC-type dipeptide/oligopeptide/nickel transport system ATPase component
VLGPELVIADEPVSMLDVSIRTELLRLMLDLRAARHLTYLFITHDLSLAWVIADRVAVMYLGKIMEIGPASRVISEPRHPYTQALVSVAPSPEPPAPGERAKRTILVGETLTRRRSLPAAGPAVAARSCSTAGWRSRRSSTSAAGSPPRAGWCRPARSSPSRRPESRLIRLVVWETRCWLTAR